MTPAVKAIHSIRNDLSPIFFFAELAQAGDHEAHDLVIKELVRRANSIKAGLDILAKVTRPPRAAHAPCISSICLLTGALQSRVRKRQLVS
jgi:hypothetical protein